MTSTALSRTRIARPDSFQGRVEIVKASPAFRDFPAHMSSNLGVCLKVGGAHEVTSDGKRLTYPANSLCIRYPGCVWSSEAAAVGFVSIDIAPSLLPMDVGRRMMEFIRPEGLNLGRVAEGLERSESRIAQESALVELVEWLSSRGVLRLGSDVEPSAVARVVRRAQYLLAERFTENLSLDDLVDATATNKFVLLRYFKREVGVGPHRYLVNLRIARAREMLARGVAAAEVAVATGFSDQAHLSRHFRRILGITPGEYASQSRFSILVPKRAWGQFRSRQEAELESTF